LPREVLDVVDRESAAGEGLLVVELAERTDAEDIPRFLVGPEEGARVLVPDSGEAAPPGAPPLDTVDHERRASVLQEVVEPTGPVARSRLPACACQPTSVDQHHGQTGRAVRDEVLHIGVLDVVGAVEIDLVRRQVGGELDVSHLRAFDGDVAPSHCEAAEVIESQRHTGHVSFPSVKREVARLQLG
jgi:hypothetical protein